MKDIPKEAWAPVASVIAAVLSIIAALFAARQKLKSDKNLEAFKSKIEEQHSEAAARREYEYEARKRLYNQC
jgi:hypothetical protein